MTLTGKIGDHYEIVSHLGSGAMGDVYRAVDRKMFDRPVAIKVLNEKLTDQEQGRARFRQEIQTSAKLHHPNIVRLYDWGEHQGRDFFVMELVDGRDLKGLIRGRVEWNLETRLEVAYQMADALDFAHREGVIHRDIKPGNMMVSQSESGPRVMLVDFGIAHVEQSGLTKTQSQPGTFSYMSPEQLRGDALDLRSDLFSLGIVFCELFSGQHPFSAKSEALVSTRILREDPEPPSRHAIELPPELDGLILLMLAKDAALRPDSARVVADALRDISRKTVAQSSTDEPGITGLADLERQLVVNLVTWARQKESEACLEDALAAYEKALRLDPGSEPLRQAIEHIGPRLAKQREIETAILDVERHLDGGRTADARDSLRAAQLLGPNDSRLAALERKVSELEDVSPELRERREFVSARLKEVDDALEQGRTDKARDLLKEVLRRYPDQREAALMLDHLVDIAAGGIPYGEYRAALRQARESLLQEDFDTATASCGRARELWTDGPEISVLESEISRARDETRRRTAARQAARQKQDEERAQRERELLDRYLEGVQDSLADAQEILDESPDEPRRAVEAFSRAVGALDLVLGEWPDHPVAEELRQEAQDEIATLEDRIARRVDRQGQPIPTPGRRWQIAAGTVAVVVALILAAIGVFALRGRDSASPSGDSTAISLEQALILSEATTEKVETKLRTMRAIGDLAPPDHPRRDELMREKERLGGLLEMQTNLDRLRALREEVAAEPGRATDIATSAGIVFELIQEYRGKLPANDRTAERIEKDGRAILEEIAGPEE